RLVRAQAAQGRDGSANIGALGVVKELDTGDCANKLNAVRLAAIVAQAMQQGGERAADGSGQRQCCQCVGSVVTAANVQGIGRHQALDVQLVFNESSPYVTTQRVVAFQTPGKPGHAVIDDHA